jgi:diguanylate cyclase (GGDEF)-like protein
VVLIVLYFVINFYISDKSQKILLQQATNNLQEISSREAGNLNNQLKEVSRYALLLQRDHQTFFANTPACFLTADEPQFATHENGAYFKLNNNGGSSLYYSSTTKIGEAEKHKARCSEMLDPLLAAVVETNPIITQAYLNTWDNMNRLYPFMTDAPTQYGPELSMQEFNFYYQADAGHNPDRKPVWTSAYLDPAGQGWMISIVFPIYQGDFLEGVSGLDITISAFIENILNLKMPWHGSTFMVDKDGTILAMQESVEQLFQLKELTSHTYNENIQKTVEKPEQYNIFKTENTSFRNHIYNIFNSKEHIKTIKSDGKTYIVNQEIIPETGWRMITLIEKSIIFSPINKLKELSKAIGYFAIAIMILFYIIFFLFLLRKSRKLTARIANPIVELSRLTCGLGENIKTQKLQPVGIAEIDHLSDNFNTMVNELEARTNALMSSQLREKIRKKESELLEKLALTDSLTNLDNRRKLMQKLGIEHERAGRFNRPYGIALLDIDYFKKINDTYGHQVGDQVLVDIAKLLQRHIRKTDSVGRWGGEEFLIICPETDRKGLLKLSESLREKLETHNFPVIGRKTSSFGLAIYQQGDEIKDIIARADQALYRAKENGRNKVEFK